jgi:uncharacterized membrane protein
MWGWVRLFGDGEISIRLPSVIFGVASVPLVAMLARRIFGGRAALLAALLLALSPPHLWASQAARPYALTAFLALAAEASFSRLVALPPPRTGGPPAASRGSSSPCC